MVNNSDWNQTEVSSIPSPPAVRIWGKLCNLLLLNFFFSPKSRHWNCIELSWGLKEILCGQYLEQYLARDECPVMTAVAIRLNGNA